MQLVSCQQSGVWRSPVARLLWEQEVPGSNPGAPMVESEPASQPVGPPSAPVAQLDRAPAF